VAVVVRALEALAAQVAAVMAQVALQQVQTVQPTLAAVVAVTATPARMAAEAAQASSSFPMLAHKNSVVVSLPLMAQTQFIHSPHQALLCQLHLCLHPTWLSLVVAQAHQAQVVVVALEAIAQAQQQLIPARLIL